MKLHVEEIGATVFFNPTTTPYYDWKLPTVIIHHSDALVCFLFY